MKKILLFVLVLISFAAKAQYVPSLSYGQEFQRFKPLKVLHLPVYNDDTTLQTTDTSAQIRINNGVLQYHYYGRWWDVAGTSTGGTELTFTPPLINTSNTVSLAGLSGLGTNNQILGMNNAGTNWEYKTITTSAAAVSNDVGVTLSGANAIVINLPSASATNRGLITTGTQTIAGLKTYSNLATFSSGMTLNVGSDATGDLHYRSSGSVLARLGIGSAGQVLTVVGGVPIWGAASTLDTTSLSNRINLKLNISDTSAMLSPYLRSNIAAATYYPLASNPAGYLTSGSIAGKLNISDTAAMLSPYLRSNIAASIYATNADLLIEAFNRNAADNLLVPQTRTINGHDLTFDVTVTKSDVGLGIADNTSDANKPVSTAQQTALNLKLNISDTAAMLLPYLRSAETGGGGDVASVSNSDATLTISPTTGSVVASLNTAKANTWTGAPTFSGVTTTLSGAQTAAAWGTAGINFRTVAATYTDNSSSGTVASNVSNSFGIPTLAASSATTYTTSSNVYIAGAPAAGTNATLTNAFSLHVAAGVSAFAGGIATNAGTTTSSNLFAVGGAGTSTTGASAMQIAGSSAINYRTTFSGSTSSTLSAGNNYANVVVGASPITEGSSSNHALLTNLTVKPIGTITSGAATVGNTASFYVDGAGSTTVTGENYAAYISGKTRFDLGSDATGDMFYRTTAGSLARLGVGTNGDVLTLASGLPSWAAPGGGTVTDVSGTTNRIDVATGTTTPVIDISSSYVGQSSITTLGTIGTGTWQGTAIEDTYISSAATWNAKQAGDADLTTISGLTPTNDDVLQYKAGAWANRTVAQYKTDLVLDNVNNTSDANKPISTAQQTALDLKQDALTFTGTGNTVRATSPTLVTPVLGVASATTINKVALTAPATGSTLTIADGKTLTASNSITIAGTDATVMTFPTTSATIARTDAQNSFTGAQTFNGAVSTGTGSLVFRTTNGGSNITAQFITDVDNSNSTAGAQAFGFETANGLIFTHANGTRRMMGASAKLTTVVNTAGSESSALSFYTQSAGTAATAKFTIAADGRLMGTGLHNSAGAVAGTVNQFIASGTYTPTLTNTANLAASTAYLCQWIRVGNVVTVTGRVDIDPTAATTDTQLGISLPIASDIATAQNCAGTAYSPAIAGQGAAVLGDLTNDRAIMQWMAADVTNQAMYFSFSYTVL